MKFLQKPSPFRLEFICRQGVFPPPTIFGDCSMLDIIFIAAGCALFAVAVVYTNVCERL